MSSHGRCVANPNPRRRRFVGGYNLLILDWDVQAQLAALEAESHKKDSLVTELESAIKDQAAAFRTVQLLPHSVESVVVLLLSAHPLAAQAGTRPEPVQGHFAYMPVSASQLPGMPAGAPPGRGDRSQTAGSRAATAGRVSGHSVCRGISERACSPHAGHQRGTNNLSVLVRFLLTEKAS